MNPNPIVEKSERKFEFWVIFCPADGEFLDKMNKQTNLSGAIKFSEWRHADYFHSRLTSSVKAKSQVRKFKMI